MPSAHTTNTDRLGRVPYTRQLRPFPGGTASVIEAQLAEPVVPRFQRQARPRSRKFDQASLSPVKTAASSQPRTPPGPHAEEAGGPGGSRVVSGVGNVLRLS